MTRSDDPVPRLVRAPRRGGRRRALRRLRRGRPVQPTDDPLAQRGARVGQPDGRVGAEDRRATPPRRAPRRQRRREPAAGARRGERREGRQGSRQVEGGRARRRSPRSTRTCRPTGATTRSSRSIATVTWSPRWATMSSPGNDEFELGGYPAVNDALHGWLRDDVWLLGSKMYVVVARPVEYDATQRPAGAIVGLQRGEQEVRRRSREAHAHEPRVLCVRQGGRRGESASTASTTRSSTPSAAI